MTRLSRLSRLLFAASLLPLAGCFTSAVWSSQGGRVEVPASIQSISRTPQTAAQAGRTHLLVEYRLDARAGPPKGTDRLPCAGVVEMTVASCASERFLQLACEEGWPTPTICITGRYKGRLERGQVRCERHGSAGGRSTDRGPD